VRAQLQFGRLKTMRARNQDGWIEETKARSWKAHWYEYVKDAESGDERRCHRSRIVGYKVARDGRPPMRKFEAEEALAKIVAPLNATQSSRRDDRVSLAWFVEHRWRPTVEGNWGPTTKKTNACFIGAILAEFGEKALRELDSVELQNWLNGLSAEYSRSMVFHCYTYLKSICAEAVEQDFLPKDRGRKLKRPKTRKPDETVLTWTQYQGVIDAAQTMRDRLAIKVGSGTAVRPGELFAFRWSSLEVLPSGRHALRVTETVYKAKIRPWAKTEQSEDYVPLPKRLAAELEDWRATTDWPGETDFMFPNSKGGVLDYENFEARVLEPIREKLGLFKLNFQILRRSYATRAVGERKGTLKDVQKQLRHSRPDTTLENYVKEIPDSVYAMVDSMYEEIAGPDLAEMFRTMAATGGTQ
jgi:integrase